MNLFKVIGTIAALASGTAYPIFAIIFGNTLIKKKK